MYYLKLDGEEEKWLAWSHWSTDDPDDDGFYLASRKIRASIFKEETLQNEEFIGLIKRFGTYTKIAATEQEIKKLKNRIYPRYFSIGGNGVKAMRPILREEEYKTKIELEEMSDGTWQVREIKIYTYDTPLAARNKVEEYMYAKMDREKKKAEESPVEDEFDGPF